MGFDDSEAGGMVKEEYPLKQGLKLFLFLSQG